MHDHSCTDSHSLVHSTRKFKRITVQHAVTVVQSNLLHDLSCSFPNFLLADEPTSALDVTVQKQVVEELLLMRKTYNTAMILVTHNIGVVRLMADRILVLQNGQAREYGETETVLDHPKDPYTKKLMSSVLHLKRAEN